MQLPEVALWRAVIQQAINDADMVIEDLPPWPKMPHGSLSEKDKASRSRLAHKYKKNRDDRNAREDARKWLREAALDFVRVCDMAAIEPAYVSRKFTAVQTVAR